ncbi:MAG: U32 family peptidase [Erysipelotrichaceae bacterium]|nr:U32 family peptidase [Erysipelotrichaceae bacterium]
MKDLLVFLHDADNIKNIRNAAVTGIILADRAFSSCADGTGITAEAADMIHKAGYRAIAKADRLFEQQELDQVSQYLQQLASCGIDEVIYTDIGVKILLERLNSPMKGIYAPETLLTSAPDIEVLRRDGLDGCVISKDIPLRDACAIMKLIPDYCMLRIHGPILIACSRRRYINAYLETSDTRAGAARLRSSGPRP